jgi:sugar lactone lactonase YvrE
VEGYVDGPALQAAFAAPGGMCMGPDGTIYIADATTPRIRRLKDGVVDTLAGAGVDGLADGNGVGAKFADPHGLVYDTHDPQHPALLIADSGNNAIRSLDLTDPAHPVTTVAGGVEGFNDGVGKAAQFHNPKLMQADGKGGILIADNENHRLRKLTFTAAGASVTTVTGNGQEDFLDGTLETSLLHSPNGVALDAAGNIYFTDTDNHRIRMITPDGYVVSVAGTGSRGFDNGPAQHNATFKGMRGIVVGPDGTIYEADSDNNAVRMVR